jgi:hypothetical protein
MPSDIDRLIDTVTDLDRTGRWCHMVDGDQVAAVFMHYCGHCSAINGNDSDGESDCIHKRALAQAWRDEVMARDDDYADLRATYGALR